MGPDGTSGRKRRFVAGLRPRVLRPARRALSDVLASRSVDVVEDAEELLVALGLPRPPQESPVYQGALTVQDHGKAVLSNGRLVDMAKVPYVWGHTADGFSIWPRSGGAPVAHFREGGGDAYHKMRVAWQELLERAGYRP
jgi:hypothetical protein